MSPDESRIEALASIARAAGFDADVVLELAKALRQRDPVDRWHRRLVEQLGLRVSPVPLETRFSAGLHEASHFVVAVWHGLAVSSIEVEGGVGATGACNYAPSIRGTIAPMTARLAAGVAGALGQELFAGGTDPPSVRTDMRTALARLGHLSVEEQPDEHTIASMRQACAGAREVLLANERAVFLLARMLLDRNELSAGACVAALAAAGLEIPDRHNGMRFDTTPDAEQARVALAFGEPPPPAWTPIKVPVHTVDSFRAALATAAPTLETPRMQRYLARKLAEVDR